MNRMEEYRALLQELEVSPVRLNGTVARARARKRRRRLRRALGYPAASAAAVCACFVLLVNVCTPFAAACASIPFLQDLARAVSFHPSLSAAVEHSYVQEIGLTQRANGAEMTIEYVIVDQKQLNVFFTTGGEAAPLYQVRTEVRGEDGAQLRDVGVISFAARSNGELQWMSVDFTTPEGTMPGTLRLVCTLWPLEGESAEAQAAPSVQGAVQEEQAPTEPTAVFTFDLSFDPYYTQQGKVIAVDRSLELDGQSLVLKAVEIYPTYLQIDLEDDPGNTAWLRGLELYAEDENGTRYDRPGGLSALGSPDSPFYRSFRLDSSYFAEGEHLTLYLTGAEWLERDRQWTWVDLTSGETGFLPEGVSLHTQGQKGDTISVTFRISGKDAGNCFTGWRQPGGEEDSFPSGTMTTIQDPATGEWYTDVTLPFPADAGERVELKLDHTRRLEYEQPIEIPVF